MSLPFRERGSVLVVTWGYTRFAHFTPGFNICRLQRQEGGAEFGTRRENHLRKQVASFGTREEERPTKDTNITKGVKFVAFV